MAAAKRTGIPFSAKRLIGPRPKRNARLKTDIPVTYLITLACHCRRFHHAEAGPAVPARGSRWTAALDGGPARLNPAGAGGL